MPFLSRMFENCREMSRVFRLGASGTTARTRPNRLFGRSLRIEPLEERQLLDASGLDASGLFPGQQFSVGNRPKSMSLGDLNGDGCLDLVTANSDSDDVSVLLGRGNGTFAAQTTYDVGDCPDSVALEDFNGDGCLDLVTANYSSANVSVLLGRGDGTFAAQTTYAIGNLPGSMSLGDLNGDGCLDLVTAHYYSGNVSVLLGGGDGTFAAQATFAVGEYPDATNLGDLNGDGCLDLVTASRYSDSVSVLIGRGDGTFAAQTTYAAGDCPCSVALGDLNRDGCLDLIATDAGSDSVSVLIGRGDGTFAAETTYAVGNSPDSVALGDLNEDGCLDLVTTNYSPYDNVSVLLGNGDGTFAAQTTYDVGDCPDSMTLGDLNRDGRLDMVTASSSSDDVLVLLGNGDGTFAAQAAYCTVGGYPAFLTLGDLNTDGCLDLVVGSSSSNNTSVLLGGGDGTFATQTNYAVGDAPESAALGDLNGDDRLDVVTANCGSDNISVLLGGGDGTFATQTNYAVGDRPESVALGDLNGDGRLDVVTANYYSDNISVLLGNGDGTFAAQRTYAVGKRPSSVSLGDLNGDGCLDLVTANYNSCCVSVLMGVGDGTFAAQTTYAVWPNSCAVALGDLNSDGRLDLVTADSYLGNVSILMGRGDGTFAAQTTCAVGDCPGAVALGDLNGDGCLDLVATNRGSDNVSVLMGRGDGTFAAQTTYAAGDDPRSVSLGDLNGDGCLDLVTANGGSSPDVSLLINRGNGQGHLQQNLAALSVAIASPLIVQDAVDIQYTVASTAAHEAECRRIDSIFLSTDDRLDAGDRVLTRLRRNDTFAAGQEIGYQVTLPASAFLGLATGEYWIFVRTDSGNAITETSELDNVASASVQMECAASQSLTLGETFQGSIAEGQVLYFHVDATAERPLAILLEGLATGSTVEMYLKSGEAPTSTDFLQASKKPFASSQSICVSQAQARTYYLAIYGVAVEGIVTPFSLTAQVPDFRVQTHYFGRGGTAGNRTIQVIGTELDHVRDAFLVDTGTGDEYEAINYYLQDYQHLYVTFDLTQVPLGTYDVRFTGADGAAVTVSQSFEVVAATAAAQVVPQLDYPEHTRRGTWYSFTVWWMNSTLNDVAAPVLSVTNSVAFGLAGGDASLGTQYTFLGTNTHDGPPGILRPGQAESLVFYAYNTTDSEPDAYRASVDRVNKEPSESYDWASLRVSVQPENMSDGAFAAIFDQLVAQVGSTWGDYLAMLGRNSALLWPESEDPRDPTQLLQLEFEQATAAVTPSITGRVVSLDDDFSLRGVTVRAVNVSSGLSRSATVRRDGSFVLADIEPGSYRLEVEGALASDEPSVVVVTSAASATNLEIEVSQGALLEGVVSSPDSGTGIADATLWLYRGGEVVRSATTGADGAYSIAGLAAGNYSVVVEAAGYARICVEEVALSGAHSVTQNVLLSAGAGLMGTVVDGNGDSIDLLVVIAQQQGGGLGTRYAATVEGDSFTIAGLPAGTYDLCITADGYANTWVRDVAVAAGGETVLPAITLLAAASISGSVSNGVSGLDYSDVTLAAIRGGEIVAAAVVQANGTFLLDNLQPGDYTLRAQTLVEHTVASSTTLRITSGESVSGVVLSVLSGATIEGTATSSLNGTALAGAQVILAKPDGSAEYAKTDNQGGYSFWCSALGNYVVSVPGADTPAQAIAVTSLDSAAYVANLAANVVATLSGQVRLSDGQTLSGATVSLWFAGSVVGSTQTDDTGHYEFQLAMPGTFELRVTAESGTFLPVSCSVPANDAVKQDLVSGDAALLIDLEIPTGVAPENVRVRIAGPSGVALDATPDAAGQLALSHLLPGEYRVTAMDSPAWRATGTVEAVSGDAPALNLVLEQGPCLSGTVRFTAGEPAAYAMVELLDPATGEVVALGITDSEGCYTIASAAGDYEFVVTGSSIERTLIAVSVAGDATADIMVTAATVFVTGRVVDGRGDPLANAGVLLVDGAGKSVGMGTTDANGEYAVPAIAATDLQMTVQATGCQAVNLALVNTSSGSLALADTVCTTVLFSATAVTSRGSLEAVSAAEATASWATIVATNGAVRASVSASLGRLLGYFPAPTKSPSHVVSIQAPDDCHLKTCAVAWRDTQLAIREQDRWYSIVTLTYKGIMLKTGQWYAGILALGSGLASFGLLAGSATTAATALTNSVGSALLSAGLTAAGKFAIGCASDMAFKWATATITSQVTDANGLLNSASNARASTADWLLWLNSAREGVLGSLLESSFALKDLSKAQQWIAKQAVGGLGKLLGLIDTMRDLAQLMEAAWKGLSNINTEIEYWKAWYQSYLDAYYRAVDFAKLLKDKYESCLAKPCEDRCDETPPPDDCSQGKRHSSWDPNDIIGPSGYGDDHWLVADRLLSYTIHFENDAKLATAPAQTVRVTQTLDSDLDITTFRLGDFCFGTTFVDVPEDTAFYETTLDATESLGVLVSVRAGIDVNTREIYWEFTSIDPATGDIPEDPLVGFLPPNANGTEGLGFVMYTISPASGLPSGTAIDAAASIVFDVNDPIATTPFSNLLDAAGPQSTVDALLAESYPAFLVHWSGEDDANGCGVASFDIYVATDGSPFTLWLSDTTLTQAVYEGAQVGHSYAFYSVATDGVGHAEAVPNLPDAQTTVIARPAITVEEVLIDNIPTTTIRIAFSDAVVVQPMIDDGTILAAVSLATLSGALVDMSTGQFAYDDTTHVLTWSSPTSLSTGYYALHLEGAKLPDADGTAISGGTSGLTFQLGTYAAAEIVQAQDADLQVHAYSVPTLADWDSDGVLDLVVGERAVSGEGKVRVYLNSGTNAEPTYAGFFYVQLAGSDLAIPAAGCLGAYPRVCDWNNDGRKDLLIGTGVGRIAVFLNTNTDADPQFDAGAYAQVGAADAKSDLDVGDRAAFDVVDWNNDGLDDLVVGALDGGVHVYVNSGTPESPDFQEGASAVTSSGTVVAPVGRSSVSVADLNGDGRKDLLLGDTEGQLWYWENIGTDTVPVFADPVALEAGGAVVDLVGGARSRPWIADYNGDGLLDILVGSADGLIRVYRGLTASSTVDTPSQSDGTSGGDFVHRFSVDADLPTSSVESLPITESETRFEVRWNGSDAPTGTGIAGYDVYVSDNGGKYTLWLDDTTGVSAVFTGMDRHTYAFYSVATDNAGNTEAAPATGDAVTQVVVDTTPPSVTINQAAGQMDPTTNATINFSVVFSEGVTGFSASDISFSGSTVPGALIATVTPVGTDGTTYNVAVSGITGGGMVKASVVAGAAQDGAGNLSVASTSTDNAVNLILPPISDVQVSATTSAAKTTITWKAFDASGLGNATLTIDGKTVKIRKKASGKTGASFSYSAALAANSVSNPSHTYTISVANRNGVVTTYTNTFTIAPTVPVISKVKTKVSTSNKASSISWRVTDIDGVGRVTLSIDDAVVTAGIKVSGKSTSRTYTYSGLLSAGDHKYTITANDLADAAAAPVSGSLTVKATVPVISKAKATVGTSATSTTIAWTVNDFDGVGTVKLTIDGEEVSGVTGSGTDKSATFAYSGVLGTGKHAYVITAYDTTGMAAKPVKGSFTVKAPKNAIMLTATKVMGTAKTEWLIDSDIASKPVVDIDSLDMVFSEY